MKLIVAVAKDGTIAVDGDMPWHIPSDLKHFKKETTGKTVLMGRKTFNTLNDTPLPNRQNIVFSRSLMRRDMVVERTFSRMGLYKDAVIMGGAELYSAALANDDLNEMVITEVNAVYDVDEDRKVVFPHIDKDVWMVKSRAVYQHREGDSHQYSIARYVRKPECS